MCPRLLSVQPHRHARRNCGNGRNCPELALRNRRVIENNGAGLGHTGVAPVGWTRACMHACQLTHGLVRGVMVSVHSRLWTPLGYAPAGPVLYAWASWGCAVCGVRCLIVPIQRCNGCKAASDVGRPNPAVGCAESQWNGNVRSSNRIPPMVSWAGFRIPYNPLAPSRHGGTLRLHIIRIRNIHHKPNPVTAVRHVPAQSSSEPIGRVVLTRCIHT
jgi:hypothetical protein